MKIVRQGVIFKGRPGTNRAKCCFPYICRLQDGTLLASFQAATRKHSIDSHVCLCISNDSGQTWSEPVSPFKTSYMGKSATVHLGYVSEPQPGKLVANLLWCDHKNNPSLEFFNPQTGGLLPCDIFLTRSDNGGLTWSDPQPINRKHLLEIPVPVMGPVMGINNSQWICPFETSKNYDDAGQWPHKAAYFISNDYGKTWHDFRVVAHDPESKIMYWDHRMAVLDRSTLIDFFWAYDNINAIELNAHMSISFDAGLNWTTPRDTGLIGQPWPILVNSRTFGVVTVDRTKSQNITLYKTNNLGQSFDADEPLVIFSTKCNGTHKSNLNDQLVEQSSWAYGLPTGTKLDESHLLLTYYAGNELSTDIKSCLVEL